MYIYILRKMLCLLLQIDVKLSVEYLSFSAHADAKGIMQLVRQCEPRSVLLVHGEGDKMKFLKSKIEEEFHLDCYMPANGKRLPNQFNEY